MVDWFETLAASRALLEDAAHKLEHDGFVVLPDMVLPHALAHLTEAYEAAMASASAEDTRFGSTSTRVSDFVNRGAIFDSIYVLPALLEACCRIIKQQFKLSSLSARTLRAQTPAQALHVDVPRNSSDWPLAGFILMIDEFRRENGATRFVPGSHKSSHTPGDAGASFDGESQDQVRACGPAGSLLIFNGSTWHGHGANMSNSARRSLHGAFIPRSGNAAINFAARMQPETRIRLSTLAHCLLVT